MKNGKKDMVKIEVEIHFEEVSLELNAPLGAKVIQINRYPVLYFKNSGQKVADNIYTMVLSNGKESLCNITRGRFRGGFGLETNEPVYLLVREG